MRPTVVAAVVASAAAHRQFLDMLPNGHTFYDVWPALGHVAPEPSQYQANAVTFPRNPFGLDFSANGYKWDRTLCEKDSDGDGVPNGVELGDPHCHWRVGDPVPTETPKGKLSHPGVPGVGINNLRAWWSTHRNVSLTGTDRLDTFRGVLAWELFIYHYILAPALIVVALCLAIVGVRGAHFPSFWGVCALTYLVCHVGILIGAHRCLSHHACKFTPVGKQFFGFLTAIAAQGPARSWAFLHRVHHRFCEQEIDIHSPDPQGFFWAQGLFYTGNQTLAQMNPHNYHFVAPDLEDEDAMIADGWPEAMVLPLSMILRHVSILFGLWGALFAFAAGRQLWRARLLDRHLPPRLRPAPTRAARLADDDDGEAACEGGGRLAAACCGAWQALVYSYCGVAYYFWAPMVLSMQVTMLVNSAVHIWGDEPYEDAMSEPCTAKNNAFLFWPMLGENWHNNHHGAPGSATTWVNWYQIDCQYMVMKLLELLRVVELVRTQPPSRPRAGYEMISFASIALSWLEMAAVMGMPYLAYRAYTKYEARRRAGVTPSPSASPKDAKAGAKGDAAIEAVPLTTTMSAPPSPTLDPL